MAEWSSSTAALNIILSDHYLSDSDGSSNDDKDSSESGSERQESAKDCEIVKDNNENDVCNDDSLPSSTSAA